MQLDLSNRSTISATLLLKKKPKSTSLSVLSKLPTAISWMLSALVASTCTFLLFFLFYFIVLLFSVMLNLLLSVRSKFLLFCCLFFLVATPFFVLLLEVRLVLLLVAQFVPKSKLQKYSMNRLFQ